MTTLNAAPVRLGASRAGETDTRGIDFSLAMVPGDTLASVTSVTVVRMDGQSTGPNDLTITPSGAVGPFIGTNAAGFPATVVAWWIGSGTNIAGTPVVPTPVDYQGTVKAVTTLGATLIRDFYLMVVPGLG